MTTWTKRQQLAFLAYLLLLNFVVLGSLAFVLFRRHSAPQPPPTALVQVVSQPAPTRTPFPLPTPSPTRSLMGVNDKIPTASPTYDFPNAGQAVQQSLVTSEASNNNTERSTTSETPVGIKEPVSVYRGQPSPTPTSSATPTASPSPTNTSTATVTNTATPTALPTSTQTPRPTHTVTATPTATKTPTLRPTATKTVTSLPSSPPTPTPTPRSTIPALADTGATPVAVAARNGSEPSVTVAHLASLSPAHRAKVQEQTKDTFVLDWSNISTTDETSSYHIYSDMGSGYGIYIYKAEVASPEYVDNPLAPGRSYDYHIAQVKVGQELLFAQARATTTLPDNSNPASNPALALTITPAPTPLPSDTVLLGLLSDNSYVDDVNTLTIVGEIRNDSNIDVGQAQINITFYDQSGSLIKTAAGETLLEIIPPGETSPFLITLPKPASMASYSLQATAQPATPALPPQLTIVDLKRFEDETGFFHIKGAIENTGSQIARRVKVAATIYGRDGRVINIGLVSTTPSTLVPGEQAEYDILFTYYPRYVTQSVIPLED